MIFKGRWLLLGITVVALGMLAAVYFLRSSDIEVTSIHPAQGNRFTVPEEKRSMQVQTPERALVLHLINTGQFNPPPGNTETMSSSVSPFSSGTRAASSGMSQSATGNGQEKTWLQQAATVMFPSRSDKIAAAVVRQDSPSVSATAQAQSAAPPQPQSGLPQFETPPGIGSAKGGQ